MKFSFHPIFPAFFQKKRPYGISSIRSHSMFLKCYQALPFFCYRILPWHSFLFEFNSCYLFPGASVCFCSLFCVSIVFIFLCVNALEKSRYICGTPHCSCSILLASSLLWARISFITASCHFGIFCFSASSAAFSSLI